jgi:hypothetical protein
MGPRKFPFGGIPLTMLTRAWARASWPAPLTFASQSFDERSFHLNAALMMNVSDEI